MGYSPWGRKELDTTEQLTLSLSLKNNKQIGDNFKINFKRHYIDG